MERGAPTHLTNNNQNNNTIHGSNAVVLNLNTAFNIVQQQTGAGSELTRLYELLNPLASSTRTGGGVSMNGCLAGTRHELLQQIHAFARKIEPPHVCLILGLAGMGKSALARSIVDTLANSDFSVASYFISRHVPQSRKIECLVQTLAYQLAQQDTIIREALLASFNSNPGLLHHSIRVQVQQLFVTPLSSPRGAGISPLAIIIDGLDETEDLWTLLSEVVEPVAAILPNLSRCVKLILFSREDGTLAAARSRGALQGNVDLRWLHEIDEVTVKNDMRMFVAAGLCHLRERAHLDPFWPTQAQVNSLADRAGALFIYATTVLQFLGEKRCSPKTRLEHLLSSTRPKSLKDSPFAELDTLYLKVLLTFIGDTSLSLESDLVRRLRSALAGVVYAAEPISVTALSGILGIPLDDLDPIIRDLAAIWIVPQDWDKPLFVYHLSFAEFIGDATRCAEPCLCVPPVTAHELLATGCLRRMIRDLHRDMCNRIEPGEPLPLAKDFPSGIVNEMVNPTLRYACIHGLDYHLRQLIDLSDLSPVAPESEFLGALAEFCGEHLLHWVEVRALFGEQSLNSLIQILRHLSQFMPVTWPQHAIKLLTELHDMVQQLQEIILMSPLEIYSSCLALLPDGSLAATYAAHPDAMIRRDTSRRDAWPDVRFLASQSARTTCTVTAGDWTACGFVEEQKGRSVGQSYVLLWPSLPTAPYRIDMPHDSALILRFMVFSPHAKRLATLSERSSVPGANSPCSAMIAVWDTPTQQLFARYQIRTFLPSIFSLSFDPSGSNLLCVSRQLDGVIRLPVSPYEHLPILAEGGGCDRATFSADRSRVIFGRFGGPLHVSEEASSWSPMQLPQSSPLLDVNLNRHPQLDCNLEPPIIMSSDGSVVATTFLDNCRCHTLRAWRLARVEPAETFEVYRAAHSHDIYPHKCHGVVGNPVLSCDGRLLAFIAPYGEQSELSIIVGELRWGAHPDFVSIARWTCAGFALSQLSGDGSLIVGFDSRFTLRIWESKTGRVVAETLAGQECLSRADMVTRLASLKRPTRGPGHWLMQHDPTSIPDPAVLHVLFTSAGVVGSWNYSWRSSTVFLNLPRTNKITALSCPWKATSLAFEEPRFAVLHTDGDVTLYDCATSYTRQLGIASVTTSRAEGQSFSSGSITDITFRLAAFDFAYRDTLLVAVFGGWITGIPSGDMSGHVEELAVGFVAQLATLSVSRDVLAVSTAEGEARVLVVEIHSEGEMVRLHERCRSQLGDLAHQSIALNADGSILALLDNRSREFLAGEVYLIDTTSGNIISSVVDLSGSCWWFNNCADSFCYHPEHNKLFPSPSEVLSLSGAPETAWWGHGGFAIFGNGNDAVLLGSIGKSGRSYPILDLTKWMLRHIIVNEGRNSRRSMTVTDFELKMMAQLVEWRQSLLGAFDQESIALQPIQRPEWPKDVLATKGGWLTGVLAAGVSNHDGSSIASIHIPVKQLDECHHENRCEVYRLCWLPELQGLVAAGPTFSYRRNLFSHHWSRLGGVLPQALNADIAWLGPVICFNAPESGSVILDFSKHPIFLPAPSEQAHENVDPGLSEAYPGMETSLSDDDYYDDDEDSGDE